MLLNRTSPRESDRMTNVQPLANRFLSAEPSRHDWCGRSRLAIALARTRDESDDGFRAPFCSLWLAHDRDGSDTIYVCGETTRPASRQWTLRARCWLLTIF